MPPEETIPIRVLRNDVSAIIRRVEAGELFAVTRHGRPVARLVPPGRPQRWRTGAEFHASVHLSPRDPEMLDLLRELRSDLTTDPYERHGR